MFARIDELPNRATQECPEDINASRMVCGLFFQLNDSLMFTHIIMKLLFGFTGKGVPRW